jgi:hypothetical protein
MTCDRRVGHDSENPNVHGTVGALAALGAGSAGAMDEGPVRSETTTTSSPAAKADSGASNVAYYLYFPSGRHVPYVCAGFRWPC